MSAGSTLAVDFSALKAEAIFGDWSARDVALAIPDITLVFSWRMGGWEKPLSNLAWMLWYGDWLNRQHSRFKGRKAVNVDAMVGRWHEALIQMSTAHSHAGFTDAEHGSDELMTPMLAAPIKDIRAFATKLAQTLEQDERVPFLIWSTFRRIIAPIILDRPEGEIIQLKQKLATEIAELVEKNIPKGDMIQAMAGALQWRDVKTLEKVKAAVETGGVPRVKGRQSCLFLDVDSPGADAKTLATVIL